MAYERSIETTAPPQTVWAIWSDPASWPTWNPDVHAISLVGPFESGTTGTMTTGEGTHGIELDEVRPGRSFVLMTSSMGGTSSRFECTIEPIKTGSRLTQRLDISGLLSPVISPMVGNRTAASFEASLAGLAKAAEDAARP